MCRRLEIVGLSLESVVKADVLLTDPWNIPIMENHSTEFANKGGVDGRQIQTDAIAYKGEINE
jgi:hypothetical protein